MSFTRYQGAPLPDGTSQDEFQSYNTGMAIFDRGQAVPMTTGAAVAQFAPVLLNAAGNVVASTASSGPTFGIALQAAAASGATIPVLVWGAIYNTAWAWVLTLATGAPFPGAIYTGASGGLTQTVTAELLGRAITPTDIVLYPKGR